MDRLTTKQVSDILGISRRRVIALIEQKKLKAEKFGSVYSIARQDVEFAKRRTNGRPQKNGGNGEPQFVSFFEAAREFIGSVDDDLPADLSSNKKYLEGLGTKAAEKRGVKV